MNSDASFILFLESLNNMVICFGYKFSPNMIGIQEGDNKKLSYKVHWILWEVWFLMIVLRYKDGDIRVMLVSNCELEKYLC